MTQIKGKLRLEETMFYETMLFVGRFSRDRAEFKVIRTKEPDKIAAAVKRRKQQVIGQLDKLSPMQAAEQEWRWEVRLAPLATSGGWYRFDADTKRIVADYIQYRYMDPLRLI